MRSCPLPLWIAGAWLFALSAIPGAFAATQPPPRPSAKAGEPDQDVRVTLDEIGEPVAHLLRGLSREGGPRLSARGELGEWRVHVFVSDLPQPRLRKALAEVVHGVWLRRRSGSELWLEPDPAAGGEARESLAERKRRFFDGIRDLVRSLSLDREGVARLEKTDRAAAGVLTRPTGRAAVQLVGLLNAPQWQQLEATGRLQFTPDQLEPTGQAAVRAFAQRIAELHAELRKQAQRSLPLDDPHRQRLETASDKPIQPDLLEFRVTEETGTERPYTYLHVSIRSGNHATAIPISGSGAAGPGEPRWPEAGHPSKPLVPRGAPATLRFRTPLHEWGEVLQQVAKQLGLQIVSEEYTRLHGPYPPLPSEFVGTVPEILDKLCAAFGYQWRVRDGVYEFRSATWYLDREDEPAGSLVKAAQVARARKQPLSLEWLAAAVMDGNSYPRRYKLALHVPATETLLVRFGDPLKLYASLTPAQRSALASKEGLATATLTDAQQGLLSATLARVLHLSPVPADRNSRIRLLEERSRARFTFTTGGRSTEAAIPLPEAVGR